jgi:sugar phosphate permease
VLVGLGVGTLFVSTLKILAEWYDPDRFAGRTGTLMAIGGVGSLLAGAPLAMISSRLGWRLSFVLVGIFTLILGMLVWVVVRDRPSASSAGSAAVRLGSDRIPLADGVKKVLGEKAFWPLAVWFFFDCAVFFSFGGLWGGPYLMQVYGLDKPHAGSVLSMLAVGIIIGSPCLGIVSGKFFRGRKPVIVMTAAMTVVLTAPLAFATARLSIPLLYLICFGIGFFTAAAAVIGFASVKELYPGGMAGTSTGILNIFPFAGGALFQPLLGWVLEGYHRSGGGFAPEGYGAAFRILFGCAVVSLLAGLLTRETIRAR